MTEAPTKQKTTLDEAYRILVQQVDKFDAHELIAPTLTELCDGLTLQDFHLSSIYGDGDKLAVYRDMVKAILVKNGKLADRKLSLPPKATVPTGGTSAMFTELCGLIKAAGGDAHKKVAAHLRSVTGRSIALPVYNNDKTIPESEKASLYHECIEALKAGDLSKLKGKTGEGDKRAEPDNAAAASTPNNMDNGDTISESEPNVKMTETQDPLSAAIAALQQAQKQAKTAAPTMDVKAIRGIVDDVLELRMARINIPEDEEIKELAVSAVGPLLEKADAAIKEALTKAFGKVDDRFKTFKPEIPGPELKTAIDAMLHGSILEVLKRGPVAVTKPVKLDEGDLASYIPDMDPTYIVPAETQRMLKYVKDRSADSPVNVMVVGPHGCGKTTLAEIFAAEYKMPMLVMDCANIREKRDWFGYKYTDGGSVLWHRSQFDRCLTKGGHVIVLDELPRTTDEIRNTLFPLLDHRRSTFLEERGDYVEVGAGTVIFVTANEGMAYTGCSQLDLALDDRLGIRSEVTYLSEKDEANVMVKRTGIGMPDAMKLAQIAKTIREKAIGLGATLTKTVSTRRIIEAAAAYKALGVDGLTYTLTNHFNAEGGSTSERAQVLLMVQGKFKA